MKEEGALRRYEQLGYNCEFLQCRVHRKMNCILDLRIRTGHVERPLSSGRWLLTSSAWPGGPLKPSQSAESCCQLTLHAHSFIRIEYRPRHPKIRVLKKIVAVVCGWVVTWQIFDCDIDQGSASLQVAAAQHAGTG